MIVKGQLQDAQLELSANIAGETPKLGRVVLDPVTLKAYVGDGTAWKRLGSESQLGDIRASMLEEADFQTENGAEWILADGRDVSGSDYAILKQVTNVPDLRAVYLRGKDNARGLHPDGEQALGSYQADQFASHSHSTGASNGGNWGKISGSTPDAWWTGSSTGSAGGNETRPKTVTVNYFIKINRDLGV